MVKARKTVSSAGKFLGMNTICGEDGSPYMTRVWFWGLRLHVFHRPDLDEDTHDHPWDFWTFPIWPPGGYVEEVVNPMLTDAMAERNLYAGHWSGNHSSDRSLQVVPAFRLSYRPATHCHRVLGAHDPRGDILAADATVDHFDTNVASPGVDPDRKIITLVWRGKANRNWGFLKNRDGKWCWVAWRDYVFAGGKDGPCQ